MSMRDRAPPEVGDRRRAPRPEPARCVRAPRADGLAAASELAERDARRAILDRFTNRQD
jgi:hypothetical protein